MIYWIFNKQMCGGWLV